MTDEPTQEVPPTAIARQRAQCVERAMATARCRKPNVLMVLDDWWDFPEWKRRLIQDVVLCGGDAITWLEAVKHARDLP